MNFITILLLSILGTSIVNIIYTFKEILSIPKNGYKFNYEAYQTFERRKNEMVKEENKNVNKNLLKLLLFFIPGVNIITAIIRNSIRKDIVINDPVLKETLKPMTELEKEQYSKIRNPFKKLLHLLITSGNKYEEEEYVGRIGKHLFVVDHGLNSIYSDKLEAIDYTLDEVKRLNEVTKKSFRIGTIDKENIAIIGIPNPEGLIKRIQFKSEDFKITHDYNPLTEEEAKDKTFTVYPFILDDELRKELDKEVEKIKEDRLNNKDVKVVTATYEKDLDTFEEVEETKVEQGPVLKKTLNR